MRKLIKTKTLKKIIISTIPLIMTLNSTAQNNEYFFKSKFDSVPNMNSELIVEKTIIKYGDKLTHYSESDKSTKYIGIDSYNLRNEEIQKIELVDKNQDGFVEHIIINNFEKNSTIEYIDSNKDHIFDTIKIDLYNDNKLITIKDTNFDRIIDYIK